MTEHRIKRHILLNIVMGAVMTASVSWAAAEPESEPLPPADICIEAEDLRIDGGWRVIRDREGYFPSQPGAWSGNRLRADAGDVQARAGLTFDVPRAGTYHLWTRYESAAGFDSLFRVEIRQNGRQRLFAEMGGREQAKYFPFGRRWRVQGLWGWHNADNVYQKAEVVLEAGPAELILTTGPNGRPAAARVLDLFYLTDDLDLQPGDDRPVTRSAILTRFNTTRYFKVDISPEADGPALVYFGRYRWLDRGCDYVYFTADGMTEPRRFAERLIARNAPPPEDRPAPGGSSGWQALELSTVMPARLLVGSDQPGTFWVSRHPDGRDAVAFDIGEADPTNPAGEERLIRDIIIGTGQSRYEERLLQGRQAVSMRQYLTELLEALESTEVRGRRAKRLGIVAAFEIFIDGFDFRQVAAAAGLTGQHYRFPREVYHPDAEDFGFNREQAYPTGTINRWVAGRSMETFWNGDYSDLREQFRSRAERLREAGLDHVPQNIKLLEETGPAAAMGRGFEEPERLFREYLRAQGVRPADALGRDELAAAIAEGATDEADLWERVRFNASQAAAAATPRLYYHSVYFRAKHFAKKMAEATRIIEEETGPGTLVNTGSTYINAGRAPLRGGIEPFLLKKHRGMSALFMGTSWGLGGTPEYLGPQTESYGAAVARSLAKYHDMTRGCYLISDGNRGYTPDYLELAAYAMAAGRYDWWSHYYLQYPDGCSFIGYPELFGAIRRTSHHLGAVEERLLDSEVAPARVAVGWSVTTDIWDAAQPAPSFDETGTRGTDLPGNSMYPMERHYLYLLLRHLQQPVDILGEEDLTDGYLEGYDVYFLVGDHLRPEAAAALKDWVAGGGTLVAVAGGGLRDHYGEPLDVLNAVFGIGGARLRKEARALRAKAELLHAEPLDVIRLDNGDRIPAYGYLQTLEPDGAEVLGRFRNGSAAVVAHAYGDGHALFIGALPGIAYLSGAFPMIPFGRGGEDLSGYMYPVYNRSVRAGMARLLAPYLAPAPVVSAVAEVEATVHRHGDTGAYAIALVNFSGAPRDVLRLEIDPAALGGAQTVRAEYGAVDQRIEHGRIIATLPIDKFDYLYLE